MIRTLIFLTLVVLAACGAEGDPIRPSAQPNGIAVTGQVSTGVTFDG